MAKGRRSPANPVIEDREAAAPPSNAWGQYNSSVLKLTSTILYGNLLREDTDRVRNWLVLYTLPWFEPSAKAMPRFAELAHSWEGALNNASVFSLQVRFASVDCASDKPLCNEMEVDHYPLVRHYRAGQVVASWKGRGKEEDLARLAKFLEKQLASAAAESAADVDGHLDAEDQGVLAMLSEYLAPASDVALDWLLVLTVLAVNVGLVARRALHGHLLDVDGDAGPAQLKGGEQQHDGERHAGAAAAEAEVQESLSGVQRLMPDDWLLRQRAASAASCIEL